MLRIDPLAALLILTLGALCYFLRVYKKENSFLYPSIQGFIKYPSTLRERLLFLPELLFFGALFFFLLAFLDPHEFKERSSESNAPPKEGLAIYLLLDRSGSMAEYVESGDTKWNLLKKSAIQFIKSAPQDLIGVITFARGSEVISPLTLDHKALEEKINDLTVIQNKSQDGTAMGYAIYKTAHLIAVTKAFQNELKEGERPPYLIKKAMMIIVTDGLQDPSILDQSNPLRSMGLNEAAAYAKDKGVALYIVNIDPRILGESFAPNRHQMERITSLTGGKLILGNVGELQKILESIPKSEKSSLSLRENVSEKTSFYPIFLTLGLICIGAYIALSTTFFRRAL